MMEIGVMVAAAILVRALLWAVLVVFVVWVSRRIRLRSVLWLELYLLLYVPLSLVINELFSRRIVPDYSVRWEGPFGWTTGELVANWAYGRLTIDGVILLLLALLIFADVVFLLQSAGVALNAQPARLLLGLRRRSLFVGLALVACMALLPLLTAVLWVA